MMLAKPNSMRWEEAHSKIPEQVRGSVGFDWVFIILCSWLLGGIFLDGWAHDHLPATLETFFTPWHGILYSGFLAIAAFLLGTLIRNRAKGYAWHRTVPAGYELSLLGVLIFLAGGFGDMIWHILFGIEANFEALYSPTHLLLALGGVLIGTGPLRVAYRHSTPEAANGWVQLPMLLSLTFTLSVFTFFSQDLHPMINAWIAGGPRPSSQDAIFYRSALGVASILLQSGLLMGIILLALRRWTLPTGSLTLLITLNALLLGTQQPGQYPLEVIPAAVLAGLIADVLLHTLKPTANRPTAIRVFSFTAPAVFYLIYFLTLMISDGIWWSVHLWAGAIMLAGVVGWLLSYAFVPPSSQ